MKKEVKKTFISIVMPKKRLIKYKIRKSIKKLTHILLHIVNLFL